MIGIKYGCDGGGWCSLPVTGPHGVSLWKSISRGLPFDCHIQFEVGVGFTVRFWQDIWCGVFPLRLSYLELFAISRNKEAYVADLMKFPNCVLFWKFQHHSFLVYFLLLIRKKKKKKREEIF